MFLGWNTLSPKPIIIIILIVMEDLKKNKIYIYIYFFSLISNFKIRIANGKPVHTEVGRSHKKL